MTKDRLVGFDFMVSFNKSYYDVIFRISALFTKEGGAPSLNESISIIHKGDRTNHISFTCNSVQTELSLEVSSKISDAIVIYDMYDMAFSAMRPIYNEQSSYLHYTLMTFKGGDQRMRRGKSRFSEKDVIFRRLMVNGMHVDTKDNWNSFHINNLSKELSNSLCMKAKQEISKTLHGLHPLVVSGEVLKKDQ